MNFRRNWDSTCPRIWAQWEADGVKWVVQDLPPEDEEKAIEIFQKDMIPDELLFRCNDVANNPETIMGMSLFWRGCMAQRMSLACYAEDKGVKTLVGINVCIVKSIEDDVKEPKPRNEASRNVREAIKHADSKVDVFKHLGVDKYLSAMGLVVKKEYRGARLSCRLLDAREPLCRAYGIKATSTVFTGDAAQKSATRCGFSTDAVVTFTELADIGLNYPRDDRSLKVMSKKYD